MRSAKANMLNKLWLAFALLATVFTASAQYPERPNPPRLVNDFPNLLSAADNEALETKLVQYSKSTSTQIAIVIMRSLGGADKAQYATELYERWGIGQADKDNGVLVLVAIEDRQLFISTGRGVEEYLPDAICKRIVENTIKPYFKQGDYYAGLNAGVDEMTARLSGNFVAEENDAPHKKGLPLWAIVLIVIIVVFVLPSIFGGGGGGTTFGGRGYRGGGFGGFGGGFGGGGFGGGGGGFGGFGGGSSGGGGAGGSW